MSVTRWVSTLLKAQTLPLAPILVITAFGTVCPATKLRLDASGRDVPHGYTVTNPEAAGSVTVMFNDAAVALGATPPRPATVNSTVVPPLTIPNRWNAPSIVTPSAARIHQPTRIDTRK